MQVGLMQVSARPNRRWATLAVIILSLAASVWFGLRAYGSFLLLRSAYEVGMPQGGSIRAWMTLRYVAATFRVPDTALATRLALPSETSPDATLKSLAEREGVSPFVYVQRVQQAIANVAPLNASPHGEGGTWLERTEEQFLSALLVYGYPILGTVLLLGAIGLPLPTGFSAAVAGSLSALGRMDWLTAGVVAVLASVVGDVAAYGVGWAASEPFLRRWGRWVGYMPARRARAEALFERWGGVTILLTRTLISHLSTIVSLLAGLHRYRLHAFLTFDLLGRVIWTAAYMGLGYALAGNLEAATEFLKNVAGLLLSLSALAVSTAIGLGAVTSMGSPIETGDDPQSGRTHR
ncbi:MAG TPA: DedA family protein [Hyphomicrobiaceae bacterium]|jgi:membrane protein DedA with SNARE-associated domain|nr:DedA family protein [Hyphomicrobiaceae bacterium]